MRFRSLADAVLGGERRWPRMEACYSRTWEHYDMPPHYHDRAEIMYVLKGWCLVHLFEYQQDETAQRIRITRRWAERLGPGEFIFLEPGVLHELEVPETNYMLNAEFTPVEDPAAPISLGALAAMSPDITALAARRQPALRSKDESGLLLRALEQVIEEFSKAGPKDAALADVLMAELLLRVAGNVRDHSIRVNALSYARRAAEYLAAHLDGEVRVGDVARAVGVAPAYLQRVFREAMGETIVEYLNRLRVEQSKRLLMYTEESILDVAVASGFNSRQHFFRVFNALMGMSPQQFRQERRARDARELFLFENVVNHSYDHDGGLQIATDDV